MKTVTVYLGNSGAGKDYLATKTKQPIIKFSQPAKAFLARLIGVADEKMEDKKWRVSTPVHGLTGQPSALSVLVSLFDVVQNQPILGELFRLEVERHLAAALKHSDSIAITDLRTPFELDWLIEISSELGLNLKFVHVKSNRELPLPSDRYLDELINTCQFWEFPIKNVINDYEAVEYIENGKSGAEK